MIQTLWKTIWQVSKIKNRINMIKERKNVAPRERLVWGSETTISPLHMNLRLQTFKDANAHLGLVMKASSHAWHTLCAGACILYKWFVLMYFTAQYFVEVWQCNCLYFKPRMTGNKHKSSSDTAGTTELFKVLHSKLKVSVFLCLLVFMYYLWKSIINLLQYRTI